MLKLSKAHLQTIQIDGTTFMKVYQDHGFATRRAYLESLCEEYPPEAVYALADLLGPLEDFDGLVTGLEEYCG